MVIRNDDSISIDLLNIEQFNRTEDIRKFLLSTWIQENPATKYRYFVEELSNGGRIYLERPGRLNKGCDFVIYIENRLCYKNENDMPPKHEYILNDVRAKKALLTPIQFEQFTKAMNVIYCCGRYSNAENYVTNLPLIGLDYEALLKLVRWFFIEQDVTYWASSGRKMFFDAIMDI